MAVGDGKTGLLIEEVGATLRKVNASVPPITKSNFLPTPRLLHSATAKLLFTFQLRQLLLKVPLPLEECCFCIFPNCWFFVEALLKYLSESISKEVKTLQALSCPLMSGYIYTSNPFPDCASASMAYEMVS